MVWIYAGVFIYAAVAYAGSPFQHIYIIQIRFHLV